MRILFLSNLYPPHELGGYGQLCQEVADQLRIRDHEVRVLTSRHGVHNKAHKESEDVTRSLYLQSEIDYYHPSHYFLRRPLQERANLRELRRALDQYRPDLMMVWGMWNLSLNLPYWAERWIPNRVVYYIGSYWPVDVDPHLAYWHLPARRPFTEMIKRPLRASALTILKWEDYPPEIGFEHVMCTSEFVRDTLAQAGKLPHGAKVIYGGTEPEPFLRETVQNDAVWRKPLKLLYFGRLVPDKGVHTAIEALGQLNAHGERRTVHLTIMGEGHPDYQSRLNGLVEEFGLGDQVDFTGWISRDEIPERLARFDIFLFTSVWPEPFGRTIVEAFLSGLVVIASDVGGSREILRDYDQSMLFRAEDAEGLAERIMRVMDDPGLQQRLVALGRQIALEKFTLKKMAEDIDAYIHRVVENSPSSNQL